MIARVRTERRVIISAVFRLLRGEGLRRRRDRHK